MRRERKQIRLRNFDYSSEGAYFITICTKNREHYFGEIEVSGTRHVVSQLAVSQPDVSQPVATELLVSGLDSDPKSEVVLSEIGKKTYDYLNEISEHFQNAYLDEFIIMPNHLHLILILDKSKSGEGTRHVVSQNVVSQNVVSQNVVSQPPSKKGEPISKRFNEFSNPIPGSVSVIIQQLKSSVKRWCNKNSFNDFQWQSRFHEHIIRDNESFERIKNYIINNPSNWKEDKWNQK